MSTKTNYKVLTATSYTILERDMAVWHNRGYVVEHFNAIDSKNFKGYFVVMRKVI